MIKEDKGQVSLEYLLIFAVSIILLIAFTLPLAQFGMEKSLDVSNSINAKGELSKLSNAISQVYGEGQGSKQTVYLSLDKAINIKITNSYLSASYNMKDGKIKELKLNHNSNLKSGSLFLDKGENKVVVEWPIDSGEMNVYKKY
ncbi:class III signal peptide-containing protein [Methanobrevibacter sp.]|uniref:class III signal peptide-containing protein n=1 Tax=Methanobrevibacter sp. TaxID=66852 RepID=UPI00388E6307